MLRGEFWAGDQETRALVLALLCLVSDLEKVTSLPWISASSLPNTDDHSRVPPIGIEEN